LNKTQFILFIGSAITLIMGFLSAFVPRLAYITFSAEGANFLLSGATHYVTYPPLTFSVNDFTLKLLVSAFGGILGLCSIVWEHKNAVPFLSFAGLSLGTIGFLLPFGSSPSLPNEYSTDIPWVGSLITLVGVLLMFLGFALKSTHVPKRTLCVIPVLLAVYLISPVLIFTNNLQLFVFLQANISISTLIGILILMGHLIIVWAGITGLRIPERDTTAAASAEINP
jgi:hypothetical protein